MLLFLCRRNRYGVARIEFPDFGVSDYNAPILAPDFRPSADEFERLWNEIVRALPRADLIQLEKMPETVAGRPNPMAWLAGSRPMRMRAWGFDLPETRAAYDQTLRSSVRKKLRWNRRTMDREGAVRFVRARSTAEGRKIFEALKRPRHARCEDIGAFDFIGHPVFSRFYESVVFDNWEDGFGALSALMVGDEFAATSFGLSHRGHYLLLVHSFEPGRWGNRSPGILGIDCAITHQIEAGSRYFDITVGNEPYKFQFCVKESLLYVREQAGSPVGRAVLALRRARTLAGQQIRRLPKSCLPKRWHD
jgi:CelD/BcsL family acetyltransferase involved in cellulose biosynthesis